ncbi:hypothetical protein EBZ39_05885 [bacterium]|nr:hypothetical protein [bacterium]
MADNETSNNDKKGFRVGLDRIKMSDVVKFFGKPVTLLKKTEFLEKSEISERLRQRHKSAGS